MYSTTPNTSNETQIFLQEYASGAEVSELRSIPNVKRNAKMITVVCVAEIGMDIEKGPSVILSLLEIHHSLNKRKDFTNQFYREARI